MDKSHAAGWGTDAPSPAQLKEFFDQIQTGRITGPRLQKVLNREWQVSIKEARQILGSSRFFGPEEWKRFFDLELPLYEIPEIPWPKRVLEDKRFSPRGQFLCLVPGSLNGKPLTLRLWNEVVFKPERPVGFHLGDCLDQRFAEEECQTHWMLMPISPIERSRNRVYQDQVATLPSGYEVPSTLDRVTANVLYYLIHYDPDCPRFLDDNSWARTKDKTEGGKSITVIGKPFFGISFSDWCPAADGSIAIAASRKI